MQGLFYCYFDIETTDLFQNVLSQCHDREKNQKMSYQRYLISDKSNVIQMSGKKNGFT